MKRKSQIKQIKRIKVLRTDNGGEYTSKQFEDYLKMKGIVHQKTVPHSPQQNGVAERLNRTINEIALAQIVHANVPHNLWAESVGAAVYIRNRMPMTTTGVTPYERFFGRKPRVDHIRIFGCYGYALLPETERRKLMPKAEKLRLVGYGPNSTVLATDYLMSKAGSSLFDAMFNLMRMTLEEKQYLIVIQFQHQFNKVLHRILSKLKVRVNRQLIILNQHLQFEGHCVKGKSQIASVTGFRVMN